MILSAQSIRRNALNRDNPLLYPFHERQTAHGMTFGLSAAGYDVRVEFDPDGVVSGKLLGSGSFLLCSTMEYFRLPNDLLATVHDKSSWARQGLAVQNTVAEPGWQGYLTLELTNHSDKPIHLKRGMPIAQIVFWLLDEPSEQAYVGKYQNQERGPQEAR